MPAGTSHFPDPSIQHGSFVVLPRTDGLWSVVDTRRAPGKRTVKTFKTRDKAAHAAKLWHSLGHG